MKLTTVVCASLLIVAALGTVAAHAQNNNIPQIQHVIIVIQENRTPTNLFHEDTTLKNNGAHTVPANNQGLCHYSHPPVTLTGMPLAMCADPDHSHSPSWLAMYDNGRMDGACDIAIYSNGSCNTLQCPGSNPNLCQYTYTLNTDNVLAPYFHIAESYGFANWMFSTQQGPSEEGHLFLFTGTSAPDFYGDTAQNCGNTYPCWQWFAAENDYGKGCVALEPDHILEIEPDPDGTENPNGYAPPGHPNNPGFPCFYHNSLPTLLDGAGITWRYYTQTALGGLGIWNSPQLMGPICGPSGGTCAGSDYTQNVDGYPQDILKDLGAAPPSPCNLRKVSWVIPDGNWSDHPGDGSVDAGPSWVAAIVNALGGYDNASRPITPKCYDTINGKQVPYWQDTVVLVTWDDWGGFYDDVAPPDGLRGYPNNTGKNYVYGFRVPLLVVSAYTPTGYISGSCNTGPCQPQAPFIHDFGSVLNFIEYVFGTNGQPLGSPTGIGYDNYQYADYFAPDSLHGLCGAQCPYSLSDFFNFSQQPRSFTPITGAKYQNHCFLNPSYCFGSNYPAEPDNDGIDP